MHNKFPRSGVTKEMVIDMAREHDVQFVDMQFTDILGVLKAVTIPVHKLESALDHNVWFDGSSIEGFTRITESDMYLQPDMSTFAVLPWTKGGEDVTARLICDVYMPDGTAFEGDPRNILRRQLERAAKLGFTFNTGPELEFFLFKRDEDGKFAPLPHDQAGYFDQTTDLALQIRREMAFDLDSMGIEVEALHHEVAAGQHEINFKYADALTTADNAVSFKLTLKAVAQRVGLLATFMPKPIFGVNGSGMHVHQSLASMEDGTNKFYDEDGTYGLSEMAQKFIAGQLKHIKAMNAVMNPTVNSYKRLVVGYEAPVNAAWGQKNRSALIRIPRITPAQAKYATRCELRCPDPSSNPYLTFAVMLAAGLDGIESDLPIVAPVEDNIWKLTPEQMAEKNIGSVAGDLNEALEALKNDEVIRGALGEHFFSHFYAAKKAEWDSYRTAVSQWEIDEYLNY
ncbi:MAG: type I glutamate--ammonia ligase [Candidatus Peregrinibacteria bacterium]|nr:type I glutamate--ammonia ligase [Candidatus Peregrinibacteria bacterium]